MIKYQDKIINRINQLTLDKLPRSLMIVGPLGGGKNSIVDYMVNSFSLTRKDLDDKSITYETISSMYNISSPTMFVIHMDKLKNPLRCQNVILKILEEPLSNIFIVLLSETKSLILETILNRCAIWELEMYTLEELSTYTDDIDILDLAETPGQIELYKMLPIKDMVNFANKIFDCIHIANQGNILNILKSIKFRDGDDDGYDVLLFAKILNKVAYDRYKNKVDKTMDVYLETNKLMNKTKIVGINLEYLFTTYLYELNTLLRSKLNDN